MKKIIKPAIIISLLIAFIGMAIFCGLITGDIRLPSDLTRSAQNAEEMYLRLTADAQTINMELTRIASEPETTFIPTPSINSQNWLDNFLHNPTCQIPCWENISPNTTEIDFATRIISEISGAKITILSLNTHPVIFTKEIAWDFDKTNGSGRIFTNQNGIVLQIDLWIGNKTLFLDDVIKGYGNPSAIIRGQDTPGEYYYILSYRRQGMLLSTTATSSPKEPVDIIPTTQINRITLYSLDNPDFTLSVFAFNIDDITWDGYKTYDFTTR